MTTWIAILAVGLISYVFRAAPLVLLERVRISERLDTAIRHASAAAVAALFVGALRRHGAGGVPSIALVAASATSLAVAVRGASLGRVVGAGLVVYATLVAAGLS